MPKWGKMRAQNMPQAYAPLASGGGAEKRDRVASGAEPAAAGDGQGSAPSSRVFSRRQHPSSQSFQERLTLSPLEKFRKHGKIPFKLIFHVLLIIFSSAFVVARNAQFAYFYNHNILAYQNLFSVSPSGVFPFEFYIYDVDAVTAHLSSCVTGYLTFPNTSVTRVSVADAVVLRAEFKDRTEYHTLTLADPLGPLATDPLRYVQQAQTLSIRYDFVVNQTGGLIDTGPFESASYRWRVTGLYDMRIGGNALVFSLDYRIRRLSTENNTFLALDIMTMLFSLASLFLTLKAILKAFQVYRFARRRLSHPPLQEGGMEWRGLTVWDKMTFFSWWNFLTVTFSLLFIIATSLGFQRETGNADYNPYTVDPESGFRAVAIFLCWVGLIKYLQFYIEFYMLILSIKASATRIGRFIITVAPVFMAFVFVGLTLFSDKTDVFGNIFRGCQTLFCMMNGDTLMPTFQELQGNADVAKSFFAEFFLYCYLAFFITCVLNMFIMIIETGFDIAHKTVYGVLPTMTIEHIRLREILQAAEAAEDRAVDNIAAASLGVLAFAGLARRMITPDPSASGITPPSAYAPPLSSLPGGTAPAASAVVSDPLDPFSQGTGLVAIPANPLIPPRRAVAAPLISSSGGAASAGSGAASASASASAPSAVAASASTLTTPLLASRGAAGAAYVAANSAAFAGGAVSKGGSALASSTDGASAAPIVENIVADITHGPPLAQEGTCGCRHACGLVSGDLQLPLLGTRPSVDDVHAHFFRCLEALQAQYMEQLRVAVDRRVDAEVEDREHREGQTGGASWTTESRA